MASNTKYSKYLLKHIYRCACINGHNNFIKLVARNLIMGVNKIRVFNTLYDHYKFLGLPVDLIDQYINFTIFNLKDVKEPAPVRSPVCRLNFFVFNFVKNGVGRYIIDEQTYKVEPYTLYITNAGHCPMRLNGTRSTRSFSLRSASPS